MPIDTPEKVAAKAKFDAYVAKKKALHFVPPKVDVSLEKESDKLGNDFNVVHMYATSETYNYHLTSMCRGDAAAVFYFLNNQPLVRAKFADGKTVTLQDTKNRVKTLSDRFNVPGDLHMWGGFVVSDNDDDAFLGYANLGGSGKPGIAEMAYLNRVDAWSHTTPEIVAQYSIESSERLRKPYRGVATAEVSSLLAYSQFLKDKKIPIGGVPVTAVVATARIDNDGSYMAAGANGMEVYDIDTNPNYGPALRHQLIYKLQA